MNIEPSQRLIELHRLILERDAFHKKVAEAVGLKAPDGTEMVKLTAAYSQEMETVVGNAIGNQRRAA